MTRSSFAKSFNMAGKKGDVLKRIHAFIRIGRFYFFSFVICQPLSSRSLHFSESTASTDLLLS